MKVRGKKNNSKRQALKTQHKITKKVAQSKRKTRMAIKKAKKSGAIIHKKKDKVTIPSLFPRKEEELIMQRNAMLQKEQDRVKSKDLNQQRKKVRRRTYSFFLSPGAESDDEGFFLCSIRFPSFFDPRLSSSRCSLFFLGERHSCEKTDSHFPS